MASPYQFEFQIFPGGDGKMWWRLVMFWRDNRKGEKIASSGQGHPTVQDCEDEISFVKMAINAPVYEVDC